MSIKGELNELDVTSEGFQLSSDDILALRDRSIKAFKWSALAEVTSRAIQPLVTLVLAHILSPSDFGVVAVATSAISLSQLFQDFGLSKAIVQTDKNSNSYANNAFWLNLSIASVIYIVILVSADGIASLFQSPQSDTVLRVLCLQLIISGLSTVHGALLQRNISFKSVFVIRFVSATLPGIVSIPLALFGYGVWALVFGTLSGSFIQLILYWTLNSWRPRLSFDLEKAKQMFQFSRWVLLEGLASWFISWGDSLILGYYLGVKELGQYRLALLFVITLSNIFFTPVVPVAYSFFSRLQKNLAAMRNYFEKLSRLVGFVTLPIGFSVAVLSKPLVEALLGSKWEGTEIVIAMMSVRWCLGCMVGLNSTAYSSLGRPDVSVKLLALIVIVAIPAYVFAAPYGLLIFCLARFMIAQFDNMLNYLAGLKLLKLPIGYVWRNFRLSFFGVLVMASMIFLYMKIVGVQGMWDLGMVTVAGITFYLGILWLLEKDFVKWSFKYAIQIIG